MEFRIVRFDPGTELRSRYHPDTGPELLLELEPSHLKLCSPSRCLFDEHF